MIGDHLFEREHTSGFVKLLVRVCVYSVQCTNIAPIIRSVHSTSHLIARSKYYLQLVGLNVYFASLFDVVVSACLNDN